MRTTEASYHHQVCINIYVDEYPTAVGNGNFIDTPTDIRCDIISYHALTSPAASELETQPLEATPVTSPAPSTEPFIMVETEKRENTVIRHRKTPSTVSASIMLQVCGINDWFYFRAFLCCIVRNDARLQWPFPSNEHRTLPRGSIPVNVYENEYSSIIAYTLASPEYAGTSWRSDVMRFQLHYTYCNFTVFVTDFIASMKNKPLPAGYIQACAIITIIIVVIIFVVVSLRMPHRVYSMTQPVHQLSDGAGGSLACCCC